MPNTPDTTVTWEDPRHRRLPSRGAWSAIATQLRGNPGQWALIAEDANRSLASKIASGRVSAFRPAGEFEATSVTLGLPRPPDRCKVYARYVGPTTGGTS